MSAHNLVALEQEILAEGWTVHCQDFVEPGVIPGRVDHGGYDIVLIAPHGQTHCGRGPTRAEALRVACDAAGLLPPAGPPLV